MNLAEYEATGRTIYRAFAEAVAKILETAIAANGSIKLQQIQHRAKDPDSLRQKLEKAGVALDRAIEEAAKDLAGCRLILYSNSDVARLNNARILFDNFEIVWERTKLHFPRRDGDANTSQFIGDNYVVQLKPDRAALVEYSAFAGLLCEVQVQTILNHAWSETAHDTIYKRPALSGIGQAQLASIDARMTAIQEKYLLPAGYEFQQVLNNFERLATGQRLLDADILTAIREAENNNDRVELLEQYQSHVLDLLDDPASVAPDVRAALIMCAQNAFVSPVEPIETPIGTLPGQSAVDVIEKVLSILNELRYVEPDQAYEALVQLYCDSPNQEIREKIQAAVRELAENALPVWRRAGPVVQETLLDAIANTPPQRLSEIRSLIIEVGCQCLAPEVTGTSSTSLSFTWETGAVVVSDQLAAIRDRALRMLMDLFNSSTSANERRVIFSAMKNGTRLPNQVQYGDALLVRVLQDSTALVRFLTEQVGALANDLAESIEEDLFFLYRRNRDMPVEMLNNPDVLEARDTLTAAILAFRDTLNAVPDYVIFKTLVGFETVFFYEWDLPEQATDFEAKDRYRKERLAEFVNQIDEVNADEWFERLDRYAAVESQDLATFPHMAGFITDIATAKPGIASDWLTRLPGRPLEKFRPGLLRGLYASNRATAEEYIEQAIEQGDDLSGLMHFLRFTETLDPAIFEQAFQRSLDLRDDIAIWNSLETSVRRPNDLGIPLARRVLLTAIEQLERVGHHRWTEPVWVWGNREGLLAALTDPEIFTLFGFIENLPKIDFRAEAILAVFAERFPEQVIDLFGQRLVRERAEDRDPFAERRYDAIPFNFSRLHTAMVGAVDIAVDRAFDWSSEDGALIEFRSARFIAILFPDGPPLLGNKLSAFAQSGDAARQAFVVAVLKNYQGRPFIHPVLRDLVAVLPSEAPQLRGVRSALAATGVLRGEFGHRDALLDQRKAMEDWLTDERPAVQAFARDVLHSLENEIAAAERSAREEIAMRRLDYAEPLDAPPNNPDEDQES